MTISISTEAELRAYVTGINDGSITEGAILLADINLTGGPMNCLGDADWLSYPHTFDGNGKKVSNFTNLYPAKSSQGFVGWTTSTAVVKNLTVEGTVSGGSYTGGIVGQNRGDVYGCTFRGTINTFGYNCGGIIGQHSAPAGRIIHSCFANINYTGTGAGERHGGIIGYAVMGVEVHHCRARGTMNLSGGRAGGIVGVCQGTTASNCFSSVNITVSAGNNFVGGAFGQTDNVSSIARCFSDGIVTCGGSAVGGLVGYKDGTTLVNSYYNSTTSTRSDNDGRGVPRTAAECLVEANLGGFNFTTEWVIRANGPELQMFSDLPPAIPSVNATTLRFHATVAGTITPTLTFTGGPIEVFTETSQVGSVTNYISQGTFVSGTPKSIALTIGQRLYFAIPAGTSITAMDFTDDKITGKLDSEAIQIFATITLTNSGWRWYYIEKTLLYLNSRGFIGSFFAQTGLKGIFSNDALTARATLMGAGATVSVNLAQKGAGVYSFILPFVTTAVNQIYGATITGITSPTVLIKNSGGSVMHTLNTGTITQTIAAAGAYTAEWTVTYDGTSDVGINTSTGTVDINTYDTKELPTQLIANAVNIIIQLHGTVTGDISDFSVRTKASPRLTIMGYYSGNPADFVGDVETLATPDYYVYESPYCPYIYGNVEGIANSVLAHFSLRENPKLIGDVDAFRDLAGYCGMLICPGLSGSVQNMKTYSLDIRGSVNVQGPLNTTTTPNHTTFLVSGSGLTKAQLEQAVNELYDNRFATFNGGINARDYGTELVIDDPAVVTKIMAFEAKAPANWNIKTLLPPFTFYTNFNALVGDVFNGNLYPQAAYGNFKCTFPAGAFKRTDNNQPVTEWTTDNHPIVTCLVAGNHQIKWEASYDGQSVNTQFEIGGGGIAASKHYFDIGVLPPLVAQQGMNTTNCTNIIGDVSNFNNMAGIFSCSNSSIGGPVTGLTKAYGFYFEGTDVSGPINNCLANSNWQLRNTKFTKSQIEQSLIYLQNRVPLFTGYFICDIGMPAISNKEAVTAYTNLVNRLGAANIKANVDTSPSTPPVTAGRLTTSLKSRFRTRRRF